MVTKILVSAVLVLCGGGQLSAQCAPEIRTVAGAIRNDGAGWAVIEDEQHAGLGISAVSAQDGMIHVEYSFQADVIHSFVAVPDETLARNGFFMGSSVGVESARIGISRETWRGVRSVDPADVNTVEYPWSNIWLMGLFSVVPDDC